MSDHREKNVTVDSESEVKAPKSMSRRAILRGGVTAMPAILTLHSGAALARSSNLISASQPDTTDGYGRTPCLDTNTVEYASETSNIFDLGEPPQPASVNLISDRKYYVKKKKKRRHRISPGAMCERGGTFYYKDVNDAWQQVDLPQYPRAGVVVSSGAMTSLAAHIYDTQI